MLPKETAPAIVTCPPTFISPDTDTSPSNVALPTIVTVDAKFAAPPTDTVSFKCVAPDTLNVPPTTALERSKAQGVGGKPTNVKTFAAKSGGSLLVASCYD